MNRPIEQCCWAEPGKLLAGEYPRNLDDESSAAKMAALKDAGVELFIDLTVEGELRSYRRWAAPAEYLRVPIVDMSIPETYADAAAALDAIDACIAAGKIAYVHCWGGIGRTGTIVGCWLARHCGSGEDALERLAELWRDIPKAAIHPETPQTWEQKEYVLDWPNRDPALADRAER